MRYRGVEVDHFLLFPHGGAHHLKLNSYLNSRYFRELRSSCHHEPACADNAGGWPKHAALNELRSQAFPVGPTYPAQPRLRRATCGQIHATLHVWILHRFRMTIIVIKGAEGSDMLKNLSSKQFAPLRRSSQATELLKQRAPDPVLSKFRTSATISTTICRVAMFADICRSLNNFGECRPNSGECSPKSWVCLGCLLVWRLDNRLPEVRSRGHDSGTLSEQRSLHHQTSPTPTLLGE